MDPQDIERYLLIDANMYFEENAIFSVDDKKWYICFPPNFPLPFVCTTKELLFEEFFKAFKKEGMQFIKDVDLFK